MSSVVQYSYNSDVISKLKEWHYGTNWPVVYIYYNATKAYVGETLDAVRRTEQHAAEKEFDEFDNICFISNKTFNKSVILDLESFLIKYMSAEGTRKLINGNAGVVDHNYFYRDAYADDFKEIWNELKNRGIVQKSILAIENSELFKYSPYKTLNYEQQSAAYEILRRICNINNASAQSIIQVNGGAGTGKTILAVYLIKLLADINQERPVWKTIEDEEDAESIKNIAEKLYGIKKVGFVVPMRKLRSVMEDIFDSVDGLSRKMVLAPEAVVKDYYDLLIVDEAHRLYKRSNLPGAELYIKFDKINKELMAENFTGTVSDYTELDWIIKSSRMQVLFYDSLQAIRKPDIGHKRFAEVCGDRVFKYVQLVSQMRCKGGNGYYDYVKKVLESKELGIKEYQKISDYELVVTDSVSELVSLIAEKDAELGLCRLVTGPGWKREEKILIDDKEFSWVGDSDDIGKLYSIHKIQGFDLNYAGVIFGKEVCYDIEAECIKVNRSNLGDNFVNAQDEDEMLRYVLNIYLTLMTRGIKGTFVYAVDDGLRAYLKRFLG